MWGVEICHFLYLRPVAYITACTTIQAVMSVIFVVDIVCKDEARTAESDKVIS